MGFELKPFSNSYKCRTRLADFRFTLNYTGQTQLKTKINKNVIIFLCIYYIITFIFESKKKKKGKIDLHMAFFVRCLYIIFILNKL